MENSDIRKENELFIEVKKTWFTKSCKIKDEKGEELAFIEQKKVLFSTISTKVFLDHTKQKMIGKIIPTKYLDLNHHFKFYGSREEFLGKIERKFITSKFWRTRYEYFDNNGLFKYYIVEENPWTRISNFFLKKSKRTSFIPKYFLKADYQFFDKADKLFAILLNKRKGRKRIRSIQTFNELKGEKLIQFYLSIFILLMIEK